MRTLRTNGVLPSDERAFGVLLAAALLASAALLSIPLQGGRYGAPMAPSTTASISPAPWSVAGGPGPSVSRASSAPTAPLFPNPSVVLLLPNGSVDPGARFTVGADVQDGFPGPVFYRWTDTLGDRGTGHTLAITAPRAGTVGVGLEVTDLMGLTGTANATIGVGESPSIALSSATSATDVGLPIPLSINVSGGEPPYLLAWQSLPGGGAESMSMTTASTVESSLVTATPGFLWVRAIVTDGYSISTSIQAVVATVHPSPALTIAPVARDVDVGSLAEVTGLVSEGTPPFQWTAVASLPSVNVSGSSGAAGSSEPVQWSGRFIAPGNSTVDVQVVDAVGVPVSAETTIRVFPALSSSLAVETVTPAAGALLNLSVYLAGGVLPYSYSIVLSDSERASGVMALSGPFSWIAHPVTPGYLVVQLSVTDAVYGVDHEVATVTVGPATGPPSVRPPGTPSSPTTPQPPLASSGGAAGALSAAATGGVGAALLIALVLIVLWRRRKSASPSAVAGSAQANETVRRLIEESAGTARSTLKLLAEEEGVGSAEFDAAIGHWEGEGRIRIEADADGGAAVYWKPMGATSSAGPPKPEGA